MIEYLSLTQPNLDTKPGTVTRDLFIDLQADQMDKLYKVISQVSDKQSPERMVGVDFDRWASNYNIRRKSGSPSDGIVVFTFNDLNSDIPIPNGTLVFSRSGYTYKTIGNFNISLTEKSRYAANASRMRSSLNIAGISDLYAIEVPVQAIRNGKSGDISSLQIREHNLQDSLRVTNLTSFSGGESSESDSTFFARIISSFSGAATGTSFGYRSAALNVSGVNDVLIIQPGNSLMLRDGTETIQTNDGSYRILSSGTGGKVDVYVLGRKLEEVSQTFLYTDLSGKGNATDERNDIIPGINSNDLYRTSEERRLNALTSGQLPFQPIDSVVSLTGSSSGLLALKSVDADGNISGNYEVVKDLTADVGGSPFGKDRIRFISNEKNIVGQTNLKKLYNSIDAIKYSDVTNISDVYQNVFVSKESSRVSPVDRSLIYLNHKPALNVSRVINRTTGEIYTIESQNINPDTGLNDEGSIRISGKTLPSTADILSVDYTWQHYFDRYIDYNGESSPAIFKDSLVNDSIDWGVSNGIVSEPVTLYKEMGGTEYFADTTFDIGRVTSVYSSNDVSDVIELVASTEGNRPGIILPNSEDVVSNIISIKSESGVELYNTKSGDGYFISRTIYLPTDSSGEVGESVLVRYNKIEFFSVPNGDGSFSQNTITLPSEDILIGNDLLETVDGLYLSSGTIYVDYVADIQTLVTSSLANLPLSGNSTSNSLFDSGLTLVSDSSQPLVWEYDGSDVVGIDKFGPAKLRVLMSGTVRAGKLKIVGTTLKRLDLKVSYGAVFSNGKFNLQNEVLAALGVSNSTGYYIARIDSVKNNGSSLDIIGVTQNNNMNAFPVAYSDSTYGMFEFSLPDTTINDGTITAGSDIDISLLIAKDNDFEELYFPGDLTVITDKTFSRLDKIVVSSGFRSNSGDYSGNITISAFNQPITNTNYLVDYKFKAPKEGERLILRYTMNRLISDATLAVENVRAITADVLVKEAAKLSVDVRGEVIINEEQLLNTQSILDDVSNTLVSVLNTNVLGATIDYSDLISSISSVAGVDSVNISMFNESGKSGRKSFIRALDNQYIAAGQVVFRAVKRKDFRIS